jgi:hypothetical protein
MNSPLENKVYIIFFVSLAVVFGVMNAVFPVDLPIIYGLRKFFIGMIVVLSIAVLLKYLLTSTNK